MPRLRTLVTCVVIVTGCGADEPIRGTDHLDHLPELALTEELRIGDAEDPDLGFSRLASMTLDRNGNIYAVEALDNEIRVFSPEGRLLRRIGRRGGGPGEFQGAPSFGVVGDTLWTYDVIARRITLFDPAGNVLSTATTGGVRIPLADRYGYITPSRMRADGLFTGWLSVVTSAPQGESTGVDPGATIPIPNVLFTAAGEVVDTVGWLSGPPPRMVPPPEYNRDHFQFITVGGGRHLVPDPPSDLPIWQPIEDGHVEVESPTPTDASSAAITIRRLDLAGDTIYQTRLAYRPSRFGAEELDSIAARAARGVGTAVAPVGGSGVAPPSSDQKVIANALRAAMRFPEFRPPIRHPWISDDGGVWLARDDGDTALQRWVVLRPDGTLYGEVILPSTTRPLWYQDDTLWAAVADEVDVPWLVRYRIGIP